MGKKVAIIQSCYIPWKGYFDIINSVDEFILFDDVQYTKRDWRNRNIIKTSRGSQWLSIPVKVKGKYSQLICDTEISEENWGIRHWNTISMNYSKAPFFSAFKNSFEPLYTDISELLLSRINYNFITAICSILGITTTISWSMDYEVDGSKSDRLIQLCKQADAATYISGPRAKSYIDDEQFRDAGIEIEYADYSGYPDYPQLFGDFDHNVTILDLLFNTGADAPKYMKSF